MASLLNEDDKKVSSGTNTLSITIPSTGSKSKNASNVNFFYRMVFPMKYTYYTIQISISGPNSKTFTVDRRYSEFYILHRLLRRKFSMVKTLAFPSKKFFVWSNLSKATVEERRAAFITYLERLVQLHPRPFDLNRFLSLSDYMPNSRYNTSNRGEVGSKKYGIEDFELMRVLGKGSFGKVFLVRLLETKQVYAMKVLKKSEVTRRKQVVHTKTERRIMGATDHPFIVTLRFAFQSDEKLYMVTDYCRGGELFFHLKRMKVFSEDQVRLYSAEIACGLSHLHSHKIVYRDLKPENVLLDHEGHVRITDFGLSRDDMEDQEHGAMTFCGTPEYLSPEMIYHRKTREGYGASVDWWSLGTLMYEMFTGWPPFYDKNIRTMMQKILHAPLTFNPKYKISADAQSCISGLLARNLNDRLCANGNHDQIKQHSFFKSIDWDKLYRREIKPPFIPKVKGEADITNFDRGFTRMAAKLTPENSKGKLGKTDLPNFEDFTFAESSDLANAENEDAMIDMFVKQNEDEDKRIEEKRKQEDDELEQRKKETIEALTEVRKKSSNTGKVGDDSSE